MKLIDKTRIPASTSNIRREEDQGSVKSRILIIQGVWQDLPKPSLMFLGLYQPLLSTARDN